MTRPAPNGESAGVTAVVTGGGTSGHVVPAVAILEALLDAGVEPSRLRYVGSRRGVESRIVPAALPGIEPVYLPISGLQRSWSLRAVARNLVLPLRLARSVARASSLVRRWRPSVVVSVGGYASAPMAIAAARAGVPLVCVSYDRIPGLATRRQARRAALCAVAFEGSDLPRAVVTGAPVRRRIRTLDVARERAGARAGLGVAADSTMVTVVGGSLGSQMLNDAVEPLLVRLAGTGATVRHVTGERFSGAPSPTVPAGVVYQRVGYDDDIASTYAASDVVVGRAGAGTVAEIATVGIASVLVPWSGAAEDHQRHNAAWLADAGGAVSVDDGDIDGLVDAVISLVGDPARRSGLAEVARSLGAVHRSDALVRAISSVVS